MSVCCFGLREMSEVQLDWRPMAKKRRWKGIQFFFCCYHPPAHSDATKPLSTRGKKATWVRNKSFLGEKRQVCNWLCMGRTKRRSNNGRRRIKFIFLNILSQFPYVANLSRGSFFGSLTGKRGRGNVCVCVYHLWSSRERSGWVRPKGKRRKS